MSQYYCPTSAGDIPINCNTGCCSYSASDPQHPYCVSCALLWYWILVIVVGCLLFIGSIILCCCRRIRRRRALLMVKEGNLTNRNMPLVIR